MTTAETDTVLLCHQCGELFDRQHRQIDMGDKLMSDLDVYGFTCPACAPRDWFDRRLRASALPARFHEYDWTHAAPGACREAAEAWGRGDSQGVLLYGPVGAGKTGLAACAALERLKREPVRWVSVPSLIARVTAAFDSDERQAAVMELTGNTAVVLDDIDVVKASEWVLAQLYVAVDSRVAEGAGLFVTTNRGPREIADFLGDRIASRLVGHCTVCELEGDDRRLKR